MIIFVEIFYYINYMAGNKTAIIRYRVIDKCLRNKYKSYHLVDLIEECNIVLHDFNPNYKGISKRTIQSDLTFMESEAGYSAPIVREADRNDRYLRNIYYYEDRDFSIENRPLNENEVLEMKQTLSFLGRFSGLPQMRWLDETIEKIEHTIDSKSESENFISFEENIYMSGLEYLKDIYHVIQNKQVIHVFWHSFQKGDIDIVCSPHFLKQYNNRWFLFATEHQQEIIYNIPIDRITEFTIESQTTYKTSEVDFKWYFEDVVGVSVPYNTESETIILKVDSTLEPYVLSKPIHSSQIPKRKDGKLFLELDLITNYEFFALIRSFGSSIEIISPISVRRQMQQDIDNMHSIYRE